MSRAKHRPLQGQNQPKTGPDWLEEGSTPVWYFPPSGLPQMGSAVVEPGCKTVVGSRCKQSGMFWGEPGTENVPAWHCIHASRRFNEFLREHLSAHAARNDNRPLAA